MRRYLKIVNCALIVVALIISMVLIFGLAEKLITLRNSEDESLNYTNTGNNRVFYNNKQYERNKYLKTVLLLGVDSFTEGAEPQKRYTQADFIALLVIDTLDESFSILHINRDTITDITQINDNGEKYGEFKGQIALAHSYGPTGKIQCLNTVDSVEKLLYGMDVDHYLSLTMDAVPIINDSIGGVTVTLQEDLTALGEEFVKGADITLMGDKVLEFVRWRSNDEINSNLERMARQRQYMSALSEKYLAESEKVSLGTMLDLNEHLVSDYNANQLTSLTEQLRGYEYKGIIILEGEAVKSGTYVEYHVDADALQKTVIDLFYKGAND